MVDVDIYDNDGNFLAKGTEQLTMQYAYGNTPQKASNLTREKISDLLGRRRIGSVISLTMDGIEPIVDSIGGVSMTLTSDETDLDPTYKKGTTIHLDGAAAKAFVHNRDVETRGSNISRMSRQTQFMLAMFQTIKNQGSSVVETMEDAAGDYLYQDIDADSIDHMTHYEYSGEVRSLPGENVEGAIHDEFYVDEDKLTELILDLFYTRS
jgi:anionic cell wall polymer biosynthesis LytR-Cps2A-Psr (LCP) family protein